jgi:hypothetical protein
VACEFIDGKAPSRLRLRQPTRVGRHGGDRETGARKRMGVVLEATVHVKSQFSIPFKSWAAASNF